MTAFRRGPRTAARWRQGFSLLETLLVMVLLAMLAVIVSQMLGSTTTTINRAEQRMDADAQARLVFSRMARDFEGMSHRTDVHFIFNCQAGNDAFYFFSEATGHFAENDPYGTSSSTRNTFSLVGYRLNDTISHNTRFELERLGRGLHWFDYSTAGSGDSTGVCYLPSTIPVSFAAPLADAYNNSSNLQPFSTLSVPQWDVVGDQVVRMEICLMLKDGTFSVIPVTNPHNTASAAPTNHNDSTEGYTIGSRWYDQTNKVGYICKYATEGSAVWAPLGTQDISAVIVTLAILDGRSRLVTNSTAMANFATVLGDFDPASPTSLPGTFWQTQIGQSSFAKEAGLPTTAAAKVRVYQRYFYF
jgi:prepilin-type N-terminal cleavage/methylation domain-containing protein